jgi:hypothetical protein
MTWQDVAVFVVVASAVLFLVGRNVTLKRRRKRPAETFVPLATLKKRPSAGSPDEPACH